MRVWLPYKETSAKPLPAPTIVFTSKITGSIQNRALLSATDQCEPSNSNDHTWTYYHWWPNRDKWEWIQLDFKKKVLISKLKVYWFDDGPFGG